MTSVVSRSCGRGWQREAVGDPRTPGRQRPHTVDRVGGSGPPNSNEHRRDHAKRLVTHSALLRRFEQLKACDRCGKRDAQKRPVHCSEHLAFAVGGSDGRIQRSRGWQPAGRPFKSAKPKRPPARQQPRTKASRWHERSVCRRRRMCSVREGDEWRTILDIADSLDAGLIVTGTRGQHRGSGWLAWREHVSRGSAPLVASGPGCARTR